MAKFTTEQMKAAAAALLKQGESAYPEFEPSYEKHINDGDISVDDFKVGFALGFEVAQAELN